MSKTIVNIIDVKDPLPAYLFTKEVYAKGDKLLFISTDKEEHNIALLTKCLAVDESEVESIVVVREKEEFLYEHICRAIKGRLRDNEEYYVNLAGGSRYMALSVQHVFEAYNALFFYTQTRENQIVKTIFDDSIYDDDDVVYPIAYRMTLGEYFELYGLDHDADIPRPAVRDSAFARHLFVMFSQNLLSHSDYRVLDTLRDKYRGWKYISISEVENPEKEKRMIPIPNLSRFLHYIGFVPREEGVLHQDELEYLTGGWFEEYVYYMIKATINPQDISMGVHISSNGLKHNNELDVCFIKANKLFVIECKTGVNSESLFNEIVYKVCALKEVLLGTSNSYIFSLKKDYKGTWKKTANYMNITFCDFSYLTSLEGMRSVINEMVAISQE